MSKLHLIHSGIYLPLLLSAIGLPAQAQNITPANDGTGTIVTPNGDRIDISGGQHSSDGRNQFQSFQDFGVSAGQTANFLTLPGTENIFGRIVGGNPSAIDGAIQITGSAANLFLINPAGIIFGDSASLNVPASFTATTATGIGFENNNWFNAIGSNDWLTLTGQPNAFAFASTNPGAIVNLGNLAVPAGQNLGLIGGALLNAGTLQAPGGTILLASVPGENLVRLSSPGNLLSLEVLPQAQLVRSPISEVVNPLSIPELLTGRSESTAHQIAVNPDGTIGLVGASTAIDPQAGTTLISGQVSVRSHDSPHAGSIGIFGDRVALVGATLDASSPNGGGDISIGGAFRGLGPQPNANFTEIDPNTSIVADALGFGAGGTIAIWADRSTQFFGRISARGGSEGGDGGFVEVSGKDRLSFDGRVDVRADRGNLGTLLLDPTNIFITRTAATIEPIDPEPPEFDPTEPEPESEEVTIDAATLENQSANVVLEATDNITIQPGVSLNFTTGGGSIRFIADSEGDYLGAFRMDSTQAIVAPGRDVVISGTSITAGTIDTSTLLGNAGGITLTASRGDILTGSLLASSGIGSGGAIALQAPAGAISLGSIDTQGILNGGNIDITAANEVTLSPISAASPIGEGGKIEISGTQITASGNLTTKNQPIIFNAPVLLAADIAITSAGAGSIAFADSINGTYQLTLDVDTGMVTLGTGIGNLTPLQSVTISGNAASESPEFAIATLGNIQLQNLTAPQGLSLSSQNGGIYASLLSTVNRTNAGNVTLSGKTISLTGINTQSIDGTGGTVDITATDFFRARGTFVDLNQIEASISTAGALGGGSIVLRHGGNGETPFVVGDASLNGTAGVMTRGTEPGDTIAAGNYLYTYTPEGTPAAELLQLISVPAPIATDPAPDEITPNPSPSPDPSPSPSPSPIPSPTPTPTPNEGIEPDELPSPSPSPIAVIPSPSPNVPPAASPTPSPSNGDIPPSIAPPVQVLPPTLPQDLGDGVSSPPTYPPVEVAPSPILVPEPTPIASPAPPEPTSEPIVPTPEPTSEAILVPTPEPTPELELEPHSLSPMESPATASDPDPLDPNHSVDTIENEPSIALDRLVDRQSIASLIEQGQIEDAVPEIDRLFEGQFDRTAPLTLNVEPENVTGESIRDTLQTIDRETGKKAVLLYVVVLPANEAQPKARLSLVLVAPDRPPVAKLIELDDRQLHRTIRLFLNRLNTYGNNDYLADAQQLYQWLVQPIASELEALGADTLIFSLDAGLRRIPLAALHDGQQFLVEQYSLGYIPSLSLTDTRYRSLHNAQVLAMGASEFPSGQDPLPAVPLELSTIVGNSQPIALDTGENSRGQKSERQPPETSQIGGLWRGRSFLNQAFTLDNLIRQRHEYPYGIIHLATHASFTPQQRDEAYIQFWDRRLSLEGLRQAQWYNSSVVELLVLSACETAVGDELAEMGFAGLAVRSGVKSALASLWKVSDTATLAIMSQFYRSLKEVPIKSEALRQAQISMIRGQVQLPEGQAIDRHGQVSLVPELNEMGGAQDFSHPYYWAGFTLIGSPF